MRQIDLMLITASAQVLLVDGPQGWSLPAADPDEPHFWQEVAPVNRSAAGLGLVATTIRCLQLIGDASANELRCYYALELHGAAPDRPGWRWAGAAGLDALRFAQAEQRAVVYEWLQGTPSSIRWYQPGFAGAAAAWTQAALARLGRAPTAPTEQLRSWERSALFRTPTTAGLAYTKAMPDVFSHEPALTTALAAWLPGCTAPVLAHDPAAGLLLLDSAGDRALAGASDPRLWERALAMLAELQIALADRTGALLELGVPDRRVEQLAGWADELFADEAALRRSPAGLGTDEIAALRGLRPAVQAACEILVAGPVPPSLEHGDCFPSQFLIQGERPRLIDWSDSSVAHPFFSLGFLAEPDCPLPACEQPKRALRQAYLAPWQRFAPKAELERAFDAALLLAPLHHALIYHRAILPAMAHGWEMERMLPYYLRLLISDIYK